MKRLLIISISLLVGTSLMAQPKTVDNIDLFSNSVKTTLYNDVNFKGYNFEGFAICVKINKVGTIDTCLVSLSAMPVLRDRINVVKKQFNFKALQAEAKAKDWTDVNIILPVFVLFENFSPSKTLSQLVAYTSERLQYFSTFDPATHGKAVTNSILLPPVTLLSTEAQR